MTTAAVFIGLSFFLDRSLADRRRPEKKATPRKKNDEKVSIRSNPCDGLFRRAWRSSREE
jgi:hypothetical protein